MSFRISCLIIFCIIYSVWNQASAQGVASCIYNLNRMAIVFIQTEYKDANGNTRSGTGTGFIVSRQGHVVTASHVVPAAGTFTSLRMEGRVGTRFAFPIPLSVVDRNSVADLAMLKLPQLGTEYVPVIVGRSDIVEPGSDLFAMGYPLQSELSITRGVVQNLFATIEGSLQAWWQTDLALNPGNSGGPVFNDHGAVVAIAVARQKDANQISFIIPIDTANALLGLASVTRQQEAFQDPMNCQRRVTTTDGWEEPTKMLARLGSSADSISKIKVACGPIRKEGYNTNSAGVRVLKRISVSEFQKYFDDMVAKGYQFFKVSVQEENGGIFYDAFFYPMMDGRGRLG
jgi:hypothetical protein